VGAGEHENGLKLFKNGRHFPENGCFFKKALHFLRRTLALQRSFEVSPGVHPVRPNQPLIKKRKAHDAIFLVLVFPLAPPWKFFCQRP